MIPSTILTKTFAGVRVPVAQQWRIRHAEFRDVDSTGCVWSIRSYKYLYNYFPDMITAFTALQEMATEQGYTIYEPSGPGQVETTELAMIWNRPGHWDPVLDLFIPGSGPECG